MKKYLYLLLLIHCNVFAQNGTSAAEHLLLPVSATELGMSNSNLAGVNGINALYYNPAGLHNQSGGITGMFSYMKLFADMGLSFTGVSANLGEYGTIAFSLKALEIGDIPVTTVEEPYGNGSYFTPSMLVNTLGYSNQIGSDLSLGISANIIFEKIMDTEASGLSFDLGFIYLNFASVSGLSLAAVVKNLGASMQFRGDDLLITVRDTTGSRGPRVVSLQTGEDELPFMTEIGISYSTEKFYGYGMNISGTYSGSGITESEYKVGAEFSYEDQFFLRAGYSLLERDNSEDRNIYGPSFGTGVHLNYLFDMKIDYAYRSVRFFDAISMITVRLGF